ncbi:MAG: NAD(P)H-dependent oxidoreductase [Gammaproteobacteria bacterium]|nr:NAD(P)H-dependent oxidoreductase [Gammaproteobacteria bacterium]
MAHLLVFSGSTRTESFNLKLAVQLASMAEQEGATVSLVNLSDFDLPIYNGDLEITQGLPDAAKRLKNLLQENAGFIVTCPEYNGFITPLLINAIDWCTRSEDASVDLSGFSDKTVLIASASPGPGGGNRSNTHLKTMLSGIGAIVIPQTLTVPAAHNAFDDQGRFLDDAMEKRAERLIAKFIQFTNRFE